MDLRARPCWCVEEGRPQFAEDFLEAMPALGVGAQEPERARKAGEPAELLERTLGEGVKGRDGVLAGAEPLRDPPVHLSGGIVVVRE